MANCTNAGLSLCDSSESFLQSGFWGSFKARFGWNARSFLIEWNCESEEESQPASPAKDSRTAPKPLLVIRRPLALGISFAYVPWGPELPPGFPQDDEARNQALIELAKALKPFLPKNTAFVRFDPPWYSEGACAPPPDIRLPFVRAGADVQPPDTVLMDLNQSMESLMENLKSKWRYNARLAQKKGVTVRQADESGLDVFYSLLRQTAKRDGIVIHGIDYYRTLFSQCREYQAKTDGPGLDLRLYVADHEGETLAAIVVLHRGKKAVYLYGASSDRKRNLMAPYSLQLKAMEDAKAAGCAEYDLFGIPPNADPGHPMAGLYRFKTGFGGRIIHRPGSWDFAYRPLFAGAFRAAETLRKGWRSRRKGRGEKEAKPQGNTNG
ncbi:lipid II:glycine glycyltransferase FemX [Leadbettera azotonutricia]|uniref:lipid II:glycine glycyltransferase FemX n=1 Tax=Leadbettera azotonutricia TaxID=150829 RepID=UPI0005C5AC00|nr:peptidoglycan bridge formation glycyltransferase FemA/FemB family protein [Leadbettera azotonutricia]